MKLLLFCPYNLYLPGGVQELIFASYDELTRRGYNVILVTPRPRKVPSSFKYPVRFLGSSRRIRAQSSQVDISTVDDGEVRALLSDIRPDIIHVHEPLVPFVAKALLIHADCPVVGTFHAALPETLLGRSIASLPYIPSVLKYVDVATFVSDTAQEHLSEYAPEKVYLVPNGIELGNYHEAVKRQQQTILFVGRLEKRKGVRYLLDAFSLLKETHPQAKLLIAGDGPLRRSLEQYSQSLGLKNVEFLGFVSTDKKRKLLAEASIFTSPALYGESFGIVLLEAMASGTPIVAHKNPGYLMVLRERGRLGVVDVENSADYALTLSCFMDDPELCNLWRDWAKNYVQQYDFPKIIDQYEAVYKRALK